MIVEQANKLLVNYLLLAQNALGWKRLAYWGHGRNFQATKADAFSEWIKRGLTIKVHWWFAYNQTSARLIEGLGFPKKRIAIVENAIDTEPLRNALQKLDAAKLEKIRRELGLTSKHVGLYVGGMYKEKQLAFLLKALLRIREQVPDFEMIFVGSGVEAGLVQEMAGRHRWVHYMGPKFNEEKIPYFALSQIFLMAGAVGLGILDCIALGVPMVALQNAQHGPEIEYLEDSKNGIVVEVIGKPEVYAAAVVDLLWNEDKRLALVEGCKGARGRYTLENMVENFAAGVRAALE